MPKAELVRANLADLLEGTKELAIAARSSATRRAYRYDWQIFVDFCESHGLAPLPAAKETIALFIADLSRRGRAVSTIDRVLVSISQAHKLAGEISATSSPHVREVLKGLKRTSIRKKRQAAPLTLDHLERCMKTPIGYRDRALLLTGFAGAFRRSELVALNREDFQEVPEGLVVTLRRSKTDQEGAGRRIGLPIVDGPLCPVKALRRWCDFLDVDKDPAVFRSIRKGGELGGRLSGHAVSLIVKRIVAAAGYDPDQYSGHSLRAGLATAAAAAGASEADIMAHTGHKSVKVAREYVRAGSVFLHNPVSTAFSNRRPQG